jgi:dihydroorotate dehydrogenase (NAD+) catalytic subunit
MLEFIMAGACAISIGTMAMIDPIIPIKMIDELDAWMSANNLTSLSEIIGIAHAKTEN